MIGNKHIEAPKKLRFIKRNLKGTLQELKRTLHLSDQEWKYEVRQYTIWDSHFIKESDVLEMVQKGLPVGSQTSIRLSVTALSHQLRLDLLEERRRISRLTFLYKLFCVNS